MKNNLIRKFDIDKSSLSENEKKVLDKLIKAAEAAAPIYGLQMNDKYEGANFYPHNATQEEILKVASTNPQLLSPYTIVKRKKDGSLEAIPYHIEYATYLRSVIKLIREAAVITDNKDFARRLEVQVDALEHGSYEAADIYWLTMKPYKIDIVIGPIERYEDNLLFIKTCYQGTIGIMDQERTKQAVEILDTLHSAQHKSFSFAQKVLAAQKIDARIDDAVIYSGLGARQLFAGVDLPNDPHLIEKYGSQIIIYQNLVKHNFEQFHYPIFKKLFEKTFQESYSRELLLKTSTLLILIREISTLMVKYTDAEKRLRELYPVIYEMASYVLAIKNAGTLLLKDVITQRELEGLMIMFISRAFESFIIAKGVKSMQYSGKGYAIAINYFLRSGALMEYKGISWVNFNKMFVVLVDLAATLDQILAFGDFEDAKKLIDELGNTSTCLKLLPEWRKL